jgi:thiol-disulfide isomerase/thioredoxin
MSQIMILKYPPIESILFFAVFLSFPTGSYPQQVGITVNNLNAEKAYLSTISGEKATQVDSTTPTAKGRFVLNLRDQRYHPGLYRMSFDKTRWIDFVNDGEDIEMATTATALIESLQVINSESNRLYYSFLKLNKQYKTKTDLLQLVLARYPKDDPYYRTTQTTITQLQKEYSDFISNVSQHKPASFVARYIHSSQLPVVDYNLPPDKQLVNLKAHALDNVDFGDNELVNSDLFTNKTIEYLTYYRNPQLPRELLEKEFMLAVDTILNKARINQIVYKHVTEYLVDGFRKFGFEKCIDYILENYVIKDDLCLDERPGSSLERMIKQKKVLPIGATVPNIVLPDTSGDITSLAKIGAEKILILFYSSSCPHCQATIPKLAEIYKSRNTFRVIAISLDSNRSDWISFIRTNKLNWINLNDPRGWSGIAASDYLIYATPTMILVDKGKKILAKPLTIDELVKCL